MGFQIRADSIAPSSSTVAKLIIRESKFKTSPDRVIYIPELTARSIKSRNKFLVMKPSSKASSAVK